MNEDDFETAMRFRDEYGVTTKTVNGASRGNYPLPSVILYDIFSDMTFLSSNGICVTGNWNSPIHGSIVLKTMNQTRVISDGSVAIIERELRAYNCPTNQGNNDMRHDMNALVDHESEPMPLRARSLRQQMIDLNHLMRPRWGNRSNNNDVRWLEVGNNNPNQNYQVSNTLYVRGAFQLSSGSRTTCDEYSESSEVTGDWRNHYQWGLRNLTHHVRFLHMMTTPIYLGTRATMAMKVVDIDGTVGLVVVSDNLAICEQLMDRFYDDVMNDETMVIERPYTDWIPDMNEPVIDADQFRVYQVTDEPGIAAGNTLIEKTQDRRTSFQITESMSYHGSTYQLEPGQYFFAPKPMGDYESMLDYDQWLLQLSEVLIFTTVVSRLGALTSYEDDLGESVRQINRRTISDGGVDDDGGSRNRDFSRLL